MLVDGYVFMLSRIMGVVERVAGCRGGGECLNMAGGFTQARRVKIVVPVREWPSSIHARRETNTHAVLWGRCGAG